MAKKPTKKELAAQEAAAKEAAAKAETEAQEQQARRGEQVAFIAELEYSGLFAFQGVNVEEIQPLILIECPRLLFPFARQIMAEMTQNGGYPPIMLEPPDFAAMFREMSFRLDAKRRRNPCLNVSPKYNLPIISISRHGYRHGYAV